MNSAANNASKYDIALSEVARCMNVLRRTKRNGTATEIAIAEQQLDDATESLPAPPLAPVARVF